MTLWYFTIGAVLSFFVTFLAKGKLRNFLLLTFSVLSIYALQPQLPIRYLDFWLPSLGIGLGFLGWVLITPREQIFTRFNLSTLVWVCALIFILALTRYTKFPTLITASMPPRVEKIFAPVIILVMSAFVLVYMPKSTSQMVGIGVLIGVVIALKSPEISLWMAQHLRGINSQDIQSASSFDIRWIGSSYLVFRLAHTLQDTKKGRIFTVSLQEYLIYVFFFPSLIAGPIDRIERFTKDLRAPLKPDWDFIIQRITSGLFKKFVVADSLMLISLNEQNATQVIGITWAWVLLYAYSLQIYFDFSGYTDLALALARILGIALPENFNQPYTKPNLTQFWNSWHISLTQWFRAYVFNPFTRILRSTLFPDWAIILFAQVTTMLLIGLWHGITQTFILWGLWHGLGLFFHNRWQYKFRAQITRWAHTSVRQRFIAWSGAMLTFQFVSLGWVWFTLPNSQIAITFLAKLVGL